MYSRIEVKNGYINEFGGAIVGASYYLCDAEPTAAGVDPDVEKLPTSKEIGIGSKALCIVSGNIYILGPSRVWKKYKGVSIMS